MTETTLPATQDATREHPCHACAQRMPAFDGSEALRLCQHHRFVVEASDLIPVGLACSHFTAEPAAPIRGVLRGPGPALDLATLRWCVATDPEHGSEHIDQHGEPWSTAYTDEDED